MIDVGYLDTALWEFGGDYISGDHPSGRIIRFPNSKVLNSIIYNYSWPLPYIWNEIKVQVAYNSDLEFISEAMRRVTEEDLGEAMIERVQTFRQIACSYAGRSARSARTPARNFSRERKYLAGGDRPLRRSAARIRRDEITPHQKNPCRAQCRSEPGLLSRRREPLGMAALF